MVIDIVPGIVALAILILGAELIVHRSVHLARSIGISDIFIGLTLLSIGTSVPEISTAVIASIDILLGKVDHRVAAAAVLGTSIGSDILQQTLLIAAVIPFGLVVINRKALLRDFAMMLLVTILLLIMSLDGNLSRLEGSILLCSYFCYLMRIGKKETRKIAKATLAQTSQRPEKHILADLLLILLGLTGILGSAHILLIVAQRLVTTLGIGSSLIGVTIIGTASALPELSTAVMAIRKKAGGLSIGTLVGSNITNPAMAIGVGALISGYEVPNVLIKFDLPAKILTALCVGGLLLFRRRLTFLESAIMITLYIAYIFLRIHFYPLDIYG